jgi:hypothetical protein
MSDWTIFRNTVEEGLGIRTPEQTAKTIGSVTAAQIQAGATHPSPNAYVAPTVTGDISTAISGISAAKIGGISVATLAVIALLAFVVIRGRK